VIVFVVFDATKNVLSRLMDAIDPKLVEELEQTAQAVPGVLAVEDFRARWFGRNLQIVTNVAVNPELSLVEGHAIAEEVRHALLHKNGVSLVDIHVDPYDSSGNATYHSTSQHHFVEADKPTEDHNHDHNESDHQH
jgi:divalent metal cation (Fe/Co/Zn/Cd) transporter